MEINSTNTYDLYYDIQKRCGGEIYIGVLGPVRTGKSTFIKRFMDVCVLPYMMDVHAKARAMDELPQSADGRTVTTTEPKFVPKEAAHITLKDGVDVKIRLIDCVGYMVEGAAGHMEQDKERMVKTPWFENAIPFTQAAEIGTDKVMNEHSTIGLVVTTDGSFTELPRSSYIQAEEKTINALKKLKKPFLVLLNSQKPYSEETKRLAEEMKKKYDVNVLPVNCEQLKEENIFTILENILYEFPISAMEFYMPKWVEGLPWDNRIKQNLVQCIREVMPGYNTIRDYLEKPVSLNSEYLKNTKTMSVNLENGTVQVQLDPREEYYYEMLSEMTNEKIKDEYDLLNALKEYSAMKKEYSKVVSAMNQVRMKGYANVTPERDDISLNEPEIIRHGSKYGVKIKSSSPSIHMIKANIETEIAPIVGTMEQAEDLIRFIKQSQTSENGIWETNIFGKTVEQMVNDGIHTKLAMIGDECQEKLQDTMRKIVNDSNGGLICIII